MDENYYKKYEPIFNAWHIKGLLGEGSFGKVFLIERQDFGTYRAALKAITIPQSQSEIRSVMADGMDEASVTSYFRQVVEEIVNEFVLMSKMKGNSNIVNYEDHSVQEHKGGIGWDILIRMELLTPLLDHIRIAQLTESDVIKLGIDMCNGLELCQKHNIIHRDIKPENIFVSENGNYKLGDFGIARMIEKTMSGLSKKGTYTYMAPEVYKGEQYGTNVDIYSLGIVMYRLLNENRAPFLPAYPEPITHNDREGAVMKRIGGSEIPAPVNAVGRLSEIVLKACSYKPHDRYQTPRQMREELEAVRDDADNTKLIITGGGEPSLRSSTHTEAGLQNAKAYSAEEEVITTGHPHQDQEDSDRTMSLFSGAVPLTGTQYPESQIANESKICERCGSVLAENTAFCGICGAGVNTNAGQSYVPSHMAGTPYPGPYIPPPRDPPRKKQLPLSAIIAIAAACVVCLGVGLFFLLSSGPAKNNAGTNLIDTSQEDSDSTDVVDPDSADNNKNKSEDKVTAINVKNDGINVTDLKLDIYQRLSLIAELEPISRDAVIVWENSNPGVLALLIDENGHEAIIRGVGAGSAVLRVSADNAEQTLEISVEKTSVDTRDFIIAHSSDQKLSDPEIEHLSNAELVIAWNEIYARHGFIYNSKALSEWFDMQPWYRPVYKFGTFDYSLLSTTERSNVTLLRRLRDRRNEGRTLYQGTGAHDVFFYQTFWDSSSRYIDPSEIADMATGLETALHEIYARNGRMFDNPRWSEYYKSFTWYDPYIPDYQWDDGVLNSFELANVELLRHYIALNPDLETNQN